MNLKKKLMVDDSRQTGLYAEVLLVLANEKMATKLYIEEVDSSEEEAKAFSTGFYGCGVAMAERAKAINEQMCVLRDLCLDKKLEKMTKEEILKELRKAGSKPELGSKLVDSHPYQMKEKCAKCGHNYGDHSSMDKGPCRICPKESKDRCEHFVAKEGVKKGEYPNEMDFKMVEVEEVLGEKRRNPFNQEESSWKSLDI